MGETSVLPQNPTYNDVGSLSTYQSTWDDILHHIDDLAQHGDVAEAIEYISTSMFTFLSTFTESFQMGQEANYENLLSYIGQYENAMQSDFDQMKSASSTTPPGGGNSPAEDLAADAITTFNKINTVINEDGSDGGPDYKAMISAVGGDINNQLQNITGNDISSPAELVSYWQTVWPQGTVPSETSNNISPVTNGFTALSNDISSQSSTAQSELKYYEANDEQYKSMDHDIMTELVNGEKTAVQAAQNASN